MLDADLELKGSQSSRHLDKGGARSPKKLFWPFGPQFGLKMGGGGGRVGGWGP